MLVVTIVHGLLLGTLICTTLYLNRPLFIRTMPFFLLQIGILLFLIICYKNNKEKETEKEQN